MARMKRGLGALEKWITVGILCIAAFYGCGAQLTTTPAPSCDLIPSDDTVDSVAWTMMTRTSNKGQKVEVNRTFAFFMCRAPGFVFNFPPPFPLVNQFAIWCEDRAPGVWIPSDSVPRCQPESVKAATTTAVKESSDLATLFLFQMTKRGQVPFVSILKNNNSFTPSSETFVRNAFKRLETDLGSSAPENLAPAINDVGKNIFSRKDTLAYEDLYKSAAAAQIANDPNAVAVSGKLYGQSSDAKQKKVTGTIGALIGAGVFIAVFMVCTIMSRIRSGGGRR